MASNNYAEQCNTKKEASQIADDLRQVKLFHLDVTPTDERYWGYRGMDIDQLEGSESRIDSWVAQALLEEADGFDEVSFGNTWHGWCFKIGDKYIWLAPVQEWRLENVREVHICEHRNMIDYGPCPQCVSNLDEIMRAQKVGDQR